MREEQCSPHQQRGGFEKGWMIFDIFIDATCWAHGAGGTFTVQEKQASFNLVSSLEQTKKAQI